jgi:hypothetical protein
MDPAQGLSSEKETQLSGGLKAYYSEPGFSQRHTDLDRASEGRMVNSIGLGVTVLYFIIVALFFWNDPSMRPWVGFLGILAAATVAGLALIIRNPFKTDRIGRIATKAFGIPFVILATLIWNVYAYGMLWGVVGAAFILVVTFLALLWTMSK